MGLLSAMDAVMGMPMSSVLADIPVQQEIKEALLAQPGRFCSILEIAKNYEQGEWKQLSASPKLGRIPEEALPDLFVQALDWARQIVGFTH